MKLLMIVIVGISTFMARPSAEAHQFFKLDEPVVQAAQVEQTAPEPVADAPVQPESVAEVVPEPLPAPAPKPVVQPKPKPVAKGTCDQWIAAAGITEVASAKELIRRESNCNPHARNKSSGACGVAQELPCGKSGCAWGDGACQVKWMNSYTLSRYGSWANALAHHDRMNWY